MNEKVQQNSYLFFRVMLGVLFLVPGITKLMNPAGPAGMLTKMGFPWSSVFVWILIAAEVLGGLALIVGFKVKLAVLPLAVVMIVASFFVSLPGALSSGSWVNFLFHLLALSSLGVVYSYGPGIWAVSK